MNPVKKVLIAHGDPKLKRTLVLMLADAGYDVRAHMDAIAALDTARAEWFDLALVGEKLGETTGLELVESLRRVQPTVPIALLAGDPELALVVQGIRIGLADVLPVSGDLQPLLRRVRELLNPGAVLPADETGVTAADLAEVESALARLSEKGSIDAPRASSAQTSDIRQELLRSIRERADLEAKLQKLLHEKNALEAELRMLLTQNSDSAIQQGELADLRTQREMVASAQATIETKARQLAEQREEIARERDALEIERHRVQLNPLMPEWASSAEEVEAMRDRVRAEETRQREGAMKLQAEAAQIARERRRWHDDLDLLREQETNLKEYETRLRKVQAQLEADRVQWFSTSARPDAKSPFDDGTLRDAWHKLQRASELLETERAHVRDDRLYAAEQEKALKQREEAMADREAKVAELEFRLASVMARAPAPNDPAIAPPSPIRVLARAPLDIAKSVFGGGKK